MLGLLGSHRRTGRPAATTPRSSSRPRSWSAGPTRSAASGIERFGEIQSEPPSNAVEAEKQTAELVDVASDELNDLRELRPPDELQDSYEAYLASRTRALDQLERGRDAAADRDTDAYVAAQAEGHRRSAEQAEAGEGRRPPGLQRGARERAGARDRAREK